MGSSILMAISLAHAKGVDQRVADTLTSEWGVDLIRSWNSAGWVDLPLSGQAGNSHRR